MEIDRIPSITLSLYDLNHLIYTYDEFFGDRPQSLNPHDRPIFPVLIVPYEVGRQIRTADEEEKFFHVEFFPPQTAEIWNSVGWHKSRTKILRKAGLTISYARSPKEQLRAELVDRLLRFFRSCHFSLSRARLMTEFLLSAPENPDMLQLAGLPADLSHLLKQYRESLNEQHTESRFESPTEGPGSSVQPDDQSTLRVGKIPNQHLF